MSSPPAAKRPLAGQKLTDSTVQSWRKARAGCSAAPSQKRTCSGRSARSDLWRSQGRDKKKRRERASLTAGAGCPAARSGGTPAMLPFCLPLHVPGKVNFWQKASNRSVGLQATR